MLQFGHVMLASAAKNPVWMIDDAEAAKLSKAADNVLAFYIDIEVDAKTRAWMALIMAAGAIYAPRVTSIIATRASKAPADTSKPVPTELRPNAPATQEINIPGVGKVEVPIQ